MINVHDASIEEIRNEIECYYGVSPRRQYELRSYYYDLIDELARRGVYSPTALPFDAVDTDHPLINSNTPPPEGLK